MAFGSGMIKFAIEHLARHLGPGEGGGGGGGGVTQLPRQLSYGGWGDPESRTHLPRHLGGTRAHLPPYGPDPFKYLLACKDNACINVYVYTYAYMHACMHKVTLWAPSTYVHSHAYDIL